MKPILQRLAEGDILVGDGAMGTMLIQRGLQPGECPEALNLSTPEVLEEIARLYFDAGADVVQTNTFGGSPLKLSGYGLDDSTEDVNRQAVLMVKKAVHEKAYVSGSCGPTGKILKPYGDTDPEVMAKGFERQIHALIGAGADIICVETMTDLQEAVLAVNAAKSVSPDTPVMATMTFDATPRGFFTIMGVTIQQAADGLRDAGADIIGSNCGNGIEKMVEIAREFKKATDLPLIIQSNAGLPESRNGTLVYSETPEFFGEQAKALAHAGVSVIGGCCGTTPEHIRAVRRAVDSLKHTT